MMSSGCKVALFVLLRVFISETLDFKVNQSVLSRQTGNLYPRFDNTAIELFKLTRLFFTQRSHTKNVIIYLYVVVVVVLIVFRLNLNVHTCKRKP